MVKWGVSDRGARLTEVLVFHVMASNIVFSGLESLGQDANNPSQADDHDYTETDIGPNAHDVRCYHISFKCLYPKLTYPGFRLGFRYRGRSQVRGNFNVKQYPIDEPGTLR